MILKDALKLEFNKLFEAVKEFKSDIMESVKGTNTSLSKIYDNMNIMLQLLGMDTFDPPELSMPEWMDDEQIEIEWFSRKQVAEMIAKGGIQDAKTMIGFLSTK